jgi:hypothetical protein
MSFHHANQWSTLRGSILLVGLCAIAWLGLGSTALAQPDNTVYFPYHDFSIPLILDQRAQFAKSVTLNVSDDLGKSYRSVSTVLPTAKAFPFHTQNDGTFWFVVQVEDASGQKFPPNPANVQSQMRIQVDTKPPVVNLKAVQPLAGTVGVDWDVSDEHLNLSTLILDHRRAGAPDWTTLEVQKIPEGQYSWSPPPGCNYEVRLRVKDRAGNLGEARTLVTPQATSVSPPAVAGSAAGTTTALTAAGPRGKMIHVKHRKFHLNYTLENIGPSAVGNVEVWITTAGSNAWTLYASNAPSKGPFTVLVRSAGRYGFTLRPHNGVGLAEDPPHPGDEPQVWVQVDEEPPVVKLNQVILDRGQVKIYWTASDNFLRPHPITLKYADKPDGKWEILARDLENSGSYVSNSEALPVQCYLRVEATDEAGNVGGDQSKELIKIDLKIPRVAEFDVTPAEVPPTGAATGISAVDTPTPSGPPPTGFSTPRVPAPAPTPPPSSTPISPPAGAPPVPPSAGAAPMLPTASPSLPTPGAGPAAPPPPAPISSGPPPVP